MNMKAVSNSLLVAVGLVALAGTPALAPAVLRTITHFSGILCVEAIVCGLAYLVWARSANIIQSRDTLRRLSGLKALAAQSGDPVWQLSWVGKIGFPVLLAALYSLSSLWEGAPPELQVAAEFALHGFIISSAFLVSYVALFFAGKAVRGVLPDASGLLTDNREAVINWVFAILTVAALAYFPATREAALVFGPMAFLAALIREVDILRNGLPVSAVALMGVSVVSGASTESFANDGAQDAESMFEDDEDEPGPADFAANPAYYKITHPSSTWAVNK